MLNDKTLILIEKRFINITVKYEKISIKIFYTALELYNSMF